MCTRSLLVVRRLNAKNSEEKGIKKRSHILINTYSRPVELFSRIFENNISNGSIICVDINGLLLSKNIGRRCYVVYFYKISSFIINKIIKEGVRDTPLSTHIAIDDSLVPPHISARKVSMYNLKNAILKICTDSIEITADSSTVWEKITS